MSLHEIKVEGHSGYAPEGQDIVCSGVSVLIQTLIKSIESFTDDRLNYILKPGFAQVDFGNLSEAGSLLVDSFFVGISGIADAYPDYIKLTST